MRAKQQFVIAFMVVAAMASGFVARVGVDYYPQIRRDFNSIRQGSAYAQNAVPSDTNQRSDVDLRPAEVFCEVLEHVRTDYVEPIPKSKERDLAHGALKQMLDSLRDPKTRFLTVEQSKITQDANAGKFHGIGAIVAVKQATLKDAVEEQLVIVDALPGGSASEAGLRTGDVISEVDGKSILPYDPFQRVEKYVKQTRNGQLSREKLIKLLQVENDRVKNGISFQKAEDMLTGDGDKAFALTVVRAGAKNPLKIKVAPKEFVVDPVEYKMINATTGYVQVNLLVNSAESEFSEAISSFKQNGAKGIVIDLRNAPGGVMETAQTLAGHIIGDKPVSVVQLAKGAKETLKPIAPKDTNALWSGPVVVLVNNGTNGLSEVLAAAIRDESDAALVGSKTFGSNMQQSFVMLRDGSAVTMTTGKYLTPKSQDYLGKGLVPDVTVTAGSKPGSDPQMKKAVELIATGKVKG